ncbi:hypothetical protein FACS1894172_06250 [Spirochaetia bacterium]|nr:hypothetical protein FACS1894164_20450 [Spirochaetia bacterium]GHU31399.1 hypothetical protein FACS1894172_06250 [Spirochaetia bacterium]
MGIHFYCDSCGIQVPPATEVCPNCGKTFASVRCPSCGLVGDVEIFIDGCPLCGYSSPDSPEEDSQIAFPVTAQRKSRLAESEMLIAPLPLWVYVVTGIAVMIVSFMILSIG